MASKKRRKKVSGKKRKSPKRKSTKRKKGRKSGGKIPLNILKRRLTRLSAIVKKRGG